MPDVIVIADDLSGAADTGVAFAVRGYRSVVVWDAGSYPLADVLVFSTESRNSPRDDAVSKVRTAVSQLSITSDSSLIYKKIDSTLRGHPAAELAAVMDGYGISKALVAPAFPAQKRITISGIHYVDGLPLDQTTYGKEVVTANVRELFKYGDIPYDIVVLDIAIVREGADAITGKLQDCTSRRTLVIADAETMEDLSTLARAGFAEGFRLYCGSAGLGAALAQTLNHKSRINNLNNSSYNGVGILGVIASRRESTIQQVAYARANGIPVLCPDVTWFVNPKVSVCPVVMELHSLLSTDKMVLFTAHELPDLPGKSTLICSRMADAVSELMTLTNPGGLVLSGGDMAIAVSSRLGAQSLMLCGEVQAGIPWGYLMEGRAHECPVVTKAGGFGEESALINALEFLNQQ